MTTSRMRFAALSLSAALSVGALAPFVGTTAANAACSTVTTANPHLKADQAHLKKAKKKLKKAKKHHHAKKVHKLKKKVRKLKARVRADKRSPLHSTKCSTTTTPAGTANPLNSILGSLLGSGLPSDQLTNALQGVIDQLKASRPGLEQAQRQGRALLWDKQIDRELAAQAEAARVAQKPYVYQTEPGLK